jgi:lipoprotein signal peptidase
LIVAGIGITIYGFLNDADIVTFVGVAIFILSFFLNSRIKALKHEK